MIIIFQTVYNTNRFSEKLFHLSTDPLCKAKQHDYRLEVSNIRCCEKEVV